MTHAEKAEALFLEGYNCAQAVFAAFCDLTGLEEKQALKLASGFGGGVGGMREVCGAVSGLTLTLSALYGYDTPNDRAAKLALYHSVQAAAERYREQNGSIVCRDLLGYDLTKPDEMACIKEKGLFGDICPKMIKSAVEILESVIADA